MELNTEPKSEREECRRDKAASLSAMEDNTFPVRRMRPMVGFRFRSMDAPTYHPRWLTPCPRYYAACDRKTHQHFYLNFMGPVIPGREAKRQAVGTVQRDTHCRRTS